ncbi:UvrD-helicase domain-containing protein [Myxococcota bacterium]
MTPSELRAGTKKGGTPPEHPFFLQCERLHQQAAQANQELETWRLGFLLELVTRVRHALRERLQVLGARSFSDLLQEVSQALQGRLGAELGCRLRQRYPVALIDEFQDTDPTQYDILRRVYADRSSTLFLIGDPKQAIYGFRGADVFAYLQAAGQVGAAQSYTLGTNYRSDPALVQAVNSLFGRAKRPFWLSQIAPVRVAARPGASNELTVAGRNLPGMELYWVPRTERSTERGARITKRWAQAELPTLVAQQILGLFESDARLSGRPVSPGDIAVLTRTNQQASAVQRALLRVGVPSVLCALAGVLDSPEAGELNHVLRAMVEPTRSSLLRAALVTSLFGLSGSDLFALAADESGWQLHLNRFRRWHPRWQERGFIQAFRRLTDEANVAERRLSLPAGERRFANVLHLSELLHDAAITHQLGLTGLLRWFANVQHDPVPAWKSPRMRGRFGWRLMNKRFS